MILLRSLLFSLFIPLWTVLVATCGLPLLLAPQRITTQVGRFWSFGVLVGLRVLCNITYEIRGKENLPQDSTFIIAAKHQSAWDTLVLLYYFPLPVYIFKKELQNIPFYGWYLPVMGMIPVDRKGGATALKSMLKATKHRLDEKRPVIIFPEGTRTKAGTKTESYQPGIAAIYSYCHVPVVPVALNSGLYWGKRQFLKKPGKIILEFLPSIEPNLDRAHFMQRLQQEIEQNSEALFLEGSNQTT